MLARSLPRLVLFLAIGTIDNGTVAAQRAAQPLTVAEQARASAHAASVIITRDTWGVPHVHGHTDADVAFGFLWAQCEDDAHVVEHALLSAVGRAAEVDGASAIDGDALLRAFRVPQLARAEWARSDARLRALLQGAADGYNAYVASHPGAVRRLWHVEPWVFLAPGRSGLLGTIFDDDFGPLRLDAIGATLAGRVVPPGPVTRVPRVAAAWTSHDPAGIGSNAVALGPSRSASGHPLLLVNPHGEWFGTHVVEAELESNEGWHVAGTVRAGEPIIALGHTESFAWAHTSAQPRVANAWVEHFDSAGNPLAYRYGAAYRRARVWDDTIRVLTPDGALHDSVVAFRATHHGPVLVARGDTGWSVGVAGLAEGGAIAQWYAMSRARSFAEFRRAVARVSLIEVNTIYADTAGHVWYAYGGAHVPRRDPRFDWTQPVDGADPRTEWRGLHSFSDYPQLLDPPQGWVANANSSPFQLDGGALHRSAYPRYMVREDTDYEAEQGAAYTWTWRAERLKEIFATPRRFTLEEFQRAMLDTRWTAFRRPLSVLAAAWDSLARVDSARAAPLRDPVTALRSWKLDVDSTTDVAILAYRWARAANKLIGGKPFVGVALDVPIGSPGRDAVIGALNAVALPALKEAVSALDSQYGTWRIPYGRVVRVQRPSGDDPARLDPARPSIASAGASINFGALFAAFTGRPDQPTQFVFGGNSYVSVIEVAPTMRARSVVWFGTSADSTSTHYLDQLPLFATRQMKPAWLGAKQLRGHVERAYRPRASGGDR